MDYGTDLNVDSLTEVNQEDLKYIKGLVLLSGCMSFTCLTDKVDVPTRDHGSI